MRQDIPEADALIDKYFPVLDHGFVALKDYMGGDKSVETFARTSYVIGEEERTPKQTRDLIRYLIRHRHTTPVESVVLTFHIGMPIFVARQWIRHRMSTTNEYSGRYSEMPMIFYTPDNDRVCAQSKSNKQGSAERVDHETYHKFVYENSFVDREGLVESYKWALDQGIARETARMDLPLSTYTYFYWKVDLHNLMHLISLRSDSHAQWEIQQYSDVIAGMVRAVAPLCFEAFMDYRFGSVTFSRMEMLLIREIFARYNGLRKSDPASYPDELMWVGVDGKREQDEFLLKMVDTPLKSFDLDPSGAKDGRYYSDKVKANL